MENSIVFFSLTILVLYSYWLQKYILANQKAVSNNNTHSPLETVVVIVPFRNEAENIKQLTESLFAQDYPTNLLEFVFIDDHSTDDSLSILKNCCQLSRFNLKILSLSENTGKKAALKMGVEVSSSEYILTTDADCTMSNSWVSCMMNSLTYPQKSFVIGPVKLKSKKSAFSILQQTEFGAIMACTSGAAFLKKPISCNGANLGFSRSHYENIKPYDINPQLASGDDVFFLFASKKYLTQSEIIFVPDSAALVETSAASNFKAFVHQRIRWAKKSSYFEDWQSKKFGLAVIAMNMLLLLLLSITISFKELFWLLGLCFTIKLIVDICLLHSVKNWNQINYIFPKSFFLSILYPFYLLSIALLSLLSSSKWKGRKVVN